MQIKQFPRQFYRMRAIFCAVALVALVGAAAAAHADVFDEKISQLNQQNAAAQTVLNGLENQASSYQDAIDKLQAQINDIQGKIAANEAQQAKLEKQIDDAKKKIEQYKQYLGQDIKAMYVDGQLSTIEELATSKSLSDYVDKEEYRIAAQNKIDSTIKQIAVLQEQLQKQKAELDTLVDSQKQQDAQLGESQSKQKYLLSFNQGKQAAYNSQIAANSSRINELRQEQIAANARFSGGAAGTGPTCGGGYLSKWCNRPQDSVIDDWGMYNRECVSYTAFRVAASGRNMPYWGGKGNANQWPDNARAAHIPMDYGGGARPGDVAISTSGFYGHAMYVESVNGDGTLNISQYNASLDGRYSTNTISQSGLYFIHFR